MFGSGARASSVSDYWKTYFSTEELKAVQKNAEKYTLAQIKNKSEQWHNILTGFNIKNGSITDDNIKKNEIDTNKIKGLGDFVDEKISGSSTSQDFSANNLTGTYAALDGSHITNLTASQVGAVPYSGATGQVDLNGKNLVNLGNVGIGTASPGYLLDVNGTVSMGALTATSANITNTTASTSTATGALTVAGGLGVAGDGYFGRTLSVVGQFESNYGIKTQAPAGAFDTVIVNGTLSGTNLFAHAYTDLRTLNFTTTGGYASYNAVPVASGTLAYDHVVGFQSRPHYTSSGTAGYVAGFTTISTLDGPTTNHYGVYISSPNGSGTLANSYGLYVEAPTTGTVTNHAIHVAGGTVWLGGNLSVGTDITATGFTTRYGSTFQFNNSANNSALHLSNSGGSGASNLNIDSSVSMGALTATNGTFSGNVGIGTTTPAAALDVNGQVKMQKSSSQPFACDMTHDATMAVTSAYRTCICKGTSTTWVFTTDGTTTCTW